MLNKTHIFFKLIQNVERFRNGVELKKMIKNNTIKYRVQTRRFTNVSTANAARKFYIKFSLYCNFLC